MKELKRFNEAAADWRRIRLSGRWAETPASARFNEAAADWRRIPMRQLHGECRPSRLQ